MGVTIIALTLNEIDGVKAILPQIHRSWYDQLLVVDGGSTDGTIEWCRDNGYEVLVQRRKGIRYAYFECWPHVTGDIVVTISPDGNCPVDSIPRLVEMVQAGNDLVIGSRYLGDAKSDDDDIVTAFGNWLFTRTVNILHGGHYTDAMVIYRAFRRSLVEELDLTKESSYALPERLFGTLISWEPLMSVRAAKRRLRIAELGVGEPQRIGGVRKLQILRWGAAYYVQFFHELWFWRHPHGERLPSSVHKVVGRMLHTRPARTYVDGQLFAEITFAAADGTTVTLPRVYCPNALLDGLEAGRAGEAEYLVWRGHLFAIRGKAGLDEAIGAVELAIRDRDLRALLLMTASLVFLPWALVLWVKHFVLVAGTHEMRDAIDAA